MAIPTFSPPIGPSPGTGFSPEVDVLAAKFGDGYSQPTPNGINHIKQKVSFTWETLTYSQMREIVDFFEARGGSEAFYYKPFGLELTLKWTCKSWKPKNDSGVWRISATFEQSFTAEV